MEGASEVRIEDVVDDGVEHGPAVGEPLENHERLRRDVRLAGRAGALQDVDREERKVADDKDSEQDSKDLDGPAALVRSGRTSSLSADGGRDALSEAETADVLLTL